jgi:hypothetical protein
MPEEPTLELTQTTPLGASGYSIDYPAGWTARTQEPTTYIEEQAGACERQDGFCVVHDLRSLDFMRAMGLPENASTEEMLALNREFFNWEELSEPAETELFGAPAVGLRYHDDNVWGYIWTGLADEGAFLINVAAPSEAGLDEILPTFEAMLESIREN